MRKPVLKGIYKGIFFEFVLQDKVSDAVIILPGFPGRNDYNNLIELFFERGYHVFVPRYRGTYQSTGKFLSKNIVEDLKLFTQGIERGNVRSLWDNKYQFFKMHKKLIVSGSFGGAIACGLAASYPVFSHIILASPIWDFSKHNQNNNEMDLKYMTLFVKRAYKHCFRFSFQDVCLELSKYKEVHPEFYLPKLSTPVLVLHDPNDTMVLYSHTKEMLPKLQNAMYLEHYLGHGISDSLINAFWPEIDKFIKINYVSKD